MPKKAVNDKDFTNIKIDDGFKRIIDVVVLESIKQGIPIRFGPIVWTTFISKVDVEHSLQKLLDKGFIIKKGKKDKDYTKYLLTILFPKWQRI